MMFFTTTALAVDCSPFRPDAPVEQATETEIKAEVGGLLSRLLQAGGEYRVADARKALGASADDPDSLVKWNSKLYYLCEVMNEDETISTRDRIEIMRGMMDSETDEKIKQIMGENGTNQSEMTNGTRATSLGCFADHGNLACDFLIETGETTKQIIVYGEIAGKSTRLVDNQGNTYLASRLDFAGQESRAGYVHTDLPPDVPMRGRVVFENVSNRAVSASFLDIRSSISDDMSKGYLSIMKDVISFEFRDIGFE